MSLILGINLPDRLFIVADTRLTYKLGDGDFYQDNFLKIHTFNKSISLVTAGYSQLAGYLLRKLVKSRIIDKGIIYLRENINELLIQGLDDYLSEGGKYGRRVVMIFGGFDETKKKKINSSILGDFQSQGLLAQKGQILQQRFNRTVIEGLVREVVKSGTGRKVGKIGEVKKDTCFEVNLLLYLGKTFYYNGFYV